VLSIKDLEEIAATRLLDGKVLHGAQRHDGAFYIAGYAIELKLKARICKTLQWQGFPETNKEFERFSSFRVHDLAVLLKLSGRERMVMTHYVAEWSAVVAWKPQARYAHVTSVCENQASNMLETVEILVRTL
jgi:hypothetical protein